MLAGFWLLLSQRYTQYVQAQGGGQVLNVEALLQNASEIVQGSYQTEPEGDYNLWQYRTDTSHYIDINECDAKDDGNETPKEPLSWERPGGGPRENFNDVTRWGLDGDWEYNSYTYLGITYSQWDFTETGFLSGTEYCEDRNMPDFGDNLKYDPSFPTSKPHYTRADNRGGAPTRPVSLNGGGRTPSAHDWNTSGLDADTLEDMQPFLAIGVTPLKGLKSPTLELNAWIPKEYTGQLTVKASDFCGEDIWDYRHPTDPQLYISFEGGSTKTITCTANGNRENFQVSLGGLGDPQDVRTFTHYDGSKISQKVYKLYKITAGTSLAANSSSYTNQFRLKITQPSDGYLGIAKTDITDPDEPKNALGVGMRLPGDNTASDPPTFQRLKILWKIDLYVAIDPEEGCSAKDVKGTFGLYDTDFPSQPWLKPNFLPSLKISSVPRNAFLNGDSTTWRPEVEGGAIYTFGDESKADNLWDSTTKEFFDGDRIYRFQFYNLDQRSWMQIGVPFAQFNALQKCIDRPLVKIYHGDISVGGRFGSHTTGNACLKDDLTSPPPAAAIYAHVRAEGEGSYGSSAEYGVYARGEIEGFYSKFKRGQDPPPNPTQELTFANNDATLAWGGGWEGRLRCMPNYWREVDKELKAQDSMGIDLGIDLTRADIQNTRQLYVPQAEKFTITNTDPTVDLELKTTIYVEGDLYINDNIINENEELTTQNQIYLIYLIVKGNIFIASDVTRIDAVLIALPSNHLAMPKTPPEKGRIYTCYIEGLTNSTLDIHSYDILIDKDDMALDDTNRKHEQTCRQRLTVNGALIARQVHLGRVTDPDNIVDGRITEEINLLPEYFIGTPQLPPHSDWFYKSDSITTLPTNF